VTATRPHLSGRGRSGCVNWLRNTWAIGLRPVVEATHNDLAKRVSCGGRFSFWYLWETEKVDLNSEQSGTWSGIP
jgi:hypothetical protein